MNLEPGFEAKLREAVLDDVEHKVAGEYDNVVFQAIQHSHEQLRQFDDQYDVEPIVESLKQPQVERRQGRVTVTYGWAHPAAPYFEFGTSDHTVDGNPVLSFVWEDPPQWVREEFDQARDTGGRFATGWRVFFSSVDVSGIDETRFVRAGLDWLRRELEAR